MMDLDLKERVRGAVDIVDVIGSSLTLVPKGRTLAANCPWHDDRSPSLTVNRERQTWKCWVCDIGGDVFSYVMRRDGVDFVAALKTLAEEAGIEYQTGPKVEAGSRNDKSTLLSAVKLACDAYFDQLDQPQSDDAKIARDYLESRGIDDENRKLFRIGYAPDSWDFVTSLLKDKDFRPEIAMAAGLALERRGGTGSYDLFRGRLMFPIHDMQNRAISMGGRVIPAIAERHGDRAGGKYINGPETLLFRKSRQLYGLQLARESIRKGGKALVMEGYTDVIAARQAGIDPVVAVLGTALGEDHVKLLKRLADRVVLVLDGDEAGQRRADEVLELFVTANADLRILTLPDGMDPADYIAKEGAPALTELVDQAPDALEHKLSTLTAGIDVTNDTHAVMKAIDTMTEIIAKAARMDPVKQDQMLLRLSKTFGIGTSRLEDRLEKRRGELKAKSKQNQRYRESVDRAKLKGAPGPVGQTPSSGQPPHPQNHGPIDPNLLLDQASEFDGESDPFSHGMPEGGPSSWNNAVSVIGSAPAETPLGRIDRELFEAMIEHPELAGQAVETIDPDWLETYAAKMLLEAYQQLDIEGRDLAVDSLLLLLENDFLKNEVVTMQFRIVERDGKITQTAQERFQSVLDLFRKRKARADADEQIRKLETETFDETEELKALADLFDSEKNRQQIDH